VGAGVVVVGGEGVELGLELFLGGGGVLMGEVFLQGLVEALDLAAGLGVVGAGVLGADAQGQQFQFQVPGGVVLVVRTEDEPVVAEERSGVAPGGSGLCRVRMTSPARVVAKAREARHSREWSSMMLSTSKAAPPATLTWVTSPCQHSLGNSAAKRIQELLGRLCGCGVTSPRALSTRQIVATDGTCSCRWARW
jgi:hypothetical protein